MATSSVHLDPQLDTVEALLDRLETLPALKQFAVLKRLEAAILTTLALLEASPPNPAREATADPPSRIAFDAS